jgi:LysR family transcriptional regulator, benzoate and cis,cis-muconate-responsive activator of ben and cat genes
MELRHLRYFVAVAEEENVSRAASKLHVSQPGISRQIHDLEDDIGFLLFERRGKSVRLTVAGKNLLVEARDILQRSADAVKKARACVATQAEIDVGYAPSGTVEILPRALRAFTGTFPKMRVNLHDLSAQDMLPLLLQKKLDVALTLPPDKLPRELDMKELEHYEPRLAVGTTHPMAKLKVVSLNRIASEPVAALNRKDYPHYHKHLKKLFATIGRKPRISSEHDSGTSLMAAVAAGHEFTLLPSCVSGVAGTRLKLLKLRPPTLPQWSIVALWRKDAETEPVKAFIAGALAKPTKNERLT